MLMTWLILCIVILLVAILFVCYKLANVVISPRKRSFREAMQQEIEKKYIVEGYYDTLDKENFTLLSKYDYNLKCQLIMNTNPSNKYIIFCHGYGFNRVGSIKYIDIFLKEGFNIFLYDHRNSGDSDGPYTTMGYFEKEDLKFVVDYLYHRFGNDIIIGTHGESMGAATVLLHCSEDRRVQFVIADCPYSNLNKQLAYRLKLEYKLPQFPFLYISSLIAKIKAGFFFGQISPIDAIQKNTGLADIPIFFIHGDADDYILPYMSHDMYNIKKGYRKIYMAKGADHATSVCVDKEEYAQQVHDFLNDVLS